MEEQLISKKDLLEITNISYGQLYRWKRKNLIPEEWFVKKSSFTGQETYFPKDKILERIKKITNMKDDLSLNDIAEMFSPELADILMDGHELIEKSVVSQSSLDVYKKYNENIDTFTFENILYIYVIDKFLLSGSISIEECGILIDCLKENYKKFAGRRCELVFMRKLGVGVCFLILSPNEFYIEKSSKLVEKLDLLKCIEELKLKLIDGGL